MKLFRLLLLGLAGAAAAFSPAATRDELYNQAEADRTAGRHEAAVAGYTAVLRTEPRNGHTWVRRAASLNSLSRYEEAMLDQCRAHAAFVLANEDKRARAIALNNRAESAFNAGDIAGAFADGFAASKVDETYGRPLWSIADAWYAVGNLAQAQSFLADARKLDASINSTYTADGAAAKGRGRTAPDDKANIDADFAAAVAAYDKKDYAGALAIYDRILALKPLNSGAWGNRGNALKALGRHAEAVISQSRAAAVAGSMGGKMESVARHFTNRLNCWLDLGDTEAALVDGELAVRAYPEGSRGWQRLAAAWYEWGDLEKAEVNVAEAKQRDASFKGYAMDSAGARLNRTKRLARTGDTSALRELVATAETTHPGIFTPNTARDAAIAVLDGLLKTSPRDVALLILRSRAEDAPASGMKLNSDKGALQWVDRALALESANAEALLVRGLVRIELPEEEAALIAAGYADLDRAIALGAGTAKAYARRAAHKSESKDFAAAAADLTEALRLAPDDEDHLRDRALAHERNRDWPRALADRTRLIELQPGEWIRYGNRAEVHLSAGDTANALADFARALERNPKDPDAHLGRAAAFRALGKTAEARAEHALARQLDPSLPALAADLSNAAEIEALRNDFKHALKRTSVAIAELNDANLAVMKAEREKDRAEERLRRLFSGDKRTPDAIVAEVTEREGEDWADAEDFRDRAGAYAKLEKVTEALADLDRAIALDPAHAGAFNLRGRIRESRREFDAAFADYNKAVSLAPKDADFARDRGDIYWERKDFTAAHGDYDAAVRLDGAEALNWFKRGNARLMLARLDEAIADYDKALELKPDLRQAESNRAIARRRQGAAK